MLVQALLGRDVGSAAWDDFVRQAAHAFGASVECKQYSDTHYYNIRAVGSSFLTSPNSRCIHTIDLYNAQAHWATYKYCPETFELEHEQHRCTVELTLETTGVDLVRTLGEPTRKGGGSTGGSGAGGPGAWMEWSKKAATGDPLYVHVELDGSNAGRVVGWDAALGSCLWAVFTLSNAPV